MTREQLERNIRHARSVREVEAFMAAAQMYLRKDAEELANVAKARLAELEGYKCSS